MIRHVRIIGRCQNRSDHHEYFMFRGNLFDVINIIVHQDVDVNVWDVNLFLW